MILSGTILALAVVASAEELPVTCEGRIEQAHPIAWRLADLHGHHDPVQIARQGFAELLRVDASLRRDARQAGTAAEARARFGRVGFLDQPQDLVTLRWDGLSEPKELPAPFDDWGSAALDISADGSIVVGRLYRPLEDGEEFPQGVIRAGIWTEGSERMMLLQDLLTNQYGLGDELDEWILSGIYDITSDGRHLAGHAYNPDGEEEAFLLDLGIRGDLNGDEQLDITDINQLTGAIADGTDDLKFDINWSGTVDETDLDYWVHSAKQTYFGDANLDGEFNTGDLVHVLEAGKYETQEPAGRSEGDWNADGIFGTADLVMALDDGGYEKGPRGDAAAVPEPSGWLLLIIGLLPGLRRRLGVGYVVI